MHGGRRCVVARVVLVGVWLADGSSDRFRQLEMMWDGLDVELPDIAAFPRSLVSVGSARSGSRRLRVRRQVLLESSEPWRVKVMGAAGAGTNLAHSLLEQNLASILETDTTCLGWRRSFTDAAQSDANSKFPCRPFATSVKPGTCTHHAVPEVCLDTWSGSGIHRHAVASAPNMENLMAEANTLVVAMVRAPLSQIASWIKAPNSLRDCVHPPDYGLPKAELVCRDESIHMYASSAPGVYQVYIQGFRKFEGEGHGATLIIVPYEQLVWNPAELLRSVLAAMGREHLMPEHMIMVDEPAKDHGSSLGRQAAMDKLVNRTYLTQLRELSPDLPQRYCSVFKSIGLDLRFVVGPASRGYGADCDDVFP